MNRGTKALVMALVGVILATSAFIGGVFYDRASVPGGDALTNLVAPKTNDIGALVDQVRNIVRADALVPSSDDSMTTNAIDGVLKSLDDTHTAYYDPKQFVEFNQEESGQFYGIGVTVSLDASGQPVIGQVFPSTPAAHAGMKAGDVVVGVNGTRHASWTDIQTFVDLVRGPVGTKVTLEIERGKTPPFSLVITRTQITPPNTETKRYGQIGYVRLFSFNENAGADVRKAIVGFDKAGMKGYILDLRENPGGLVDQAVALTSLFVDSGVVVREDERGVPEQVLYATHTKVTDKPLVLLVDANSASASEIVAGALKDYGRAIIVGTRTYGKGSVQAIEKLVNGGAVKLTIAHYLTPKRVVINHVGVVPEYVVPMDLRLQLDPTKDTQLQKALEVLRTKL
jgi:carboxyl-terminal processing protease